MIESENIKNETEEKIVFKKKSRRNLRQRRNSDDEPAEEPLSLADIKERQKLRERPHGVSVAGLAIGKRLGIEEEKAIKDTFNGGLVNMHSLKAGTMKQTEEEDAYDVGIGTKFSAETNKRDEDEEMMKYIEQELQKRKGLAETTGDENMADAQKYLTPEDAALYALPDHLRQSSSHRSEEMLSNQMLNGIPEVDLGIDAKIKNIEATEEAKQKLLQDQKNKKDGPSQFVPTNMAVNFMQHNRFNIEESNDHQKRRFQQRKVGEEPHVNPNHQVGANGVKRATDDYHYDKFKKQFKRY